MKAKIKAKKTAQDIQDEIFRKMSATKKIKLALEWSLFCLKLNRLNENKRARKITLKGS